MRHVLCLAVGLALASIALAARAEDGSLATLDGKPVTAGEIKGITDTLTPAQRAQAAKDPKLAAQVVRSAIGRKLLLDQAAAKSWDKTPDVMAAIERARTDVVFASYLRSIAMPPASYPSDDEVKSAFDANRGRFKQYHIAQIYVADPPNATAEQLAAAENKARDIAKKAKAKGADFAAIAKTSSEDTATASKGGDLGWLPESQILPEVLGAVLASGKKGITDPIHAAGGWHILTLIDVKDADLLQMHDQIANALRETKLAQNEQAYVEKMLTDQHLIVNDSAAAALFAAKP